jgi:hypothetical protein
MKPIDALSQSNLTRLRRSVAMQKVTRRFDNKIVVWLSLSLLYSDVTASERVGVGVV